MIRILAALTILTLPTALAAQDDAAIIEDVVNSHILPRFEMLAERSDHLAAIAPVSYTHLTLPTSDLV